MRSTSGTTSASCSPSARPASSEIDIYDDRFLIARPLLQVLQAPERARAAGRRDRPLRPRVRGVAAGIPVRFPDHAFPSAAPIRADAQPIVVLTSNRTRELAEALRRRCVYHWIAYPDAEREAEIIMLRAGDVAEATARAVAKAVHDDPRAGRWPSRPASPKAVEWANAATILESGGSPGRKRSAARSAC